MREKEPCSPHESELRRLQLRAYLEEGRCPNCGLVFEKKHGYGSGRLDDGLFCSLDCFAVFGCEGT